MSTIDYVVEKDPRDNLLVSIFLGKEINRVAEESIFISLQSTCKG